MADKFRVMIIDDEADIRSILQICLQQEFEVVSAVNGFDALEKLDRYEPDVICSDISMPVMDGLTATKLIRRNPKFAKTPICIISANTTAEFMKEAYASGANFFISKPFEPQRVVSTVNSQIEKNKLALRDKMYSLAQLAELEAELARHSKAAAPAPAPAPAPGAPKTAAPPTKPRARAAVPIPAAAPADIMPRIMVIDDEEHVVLNLCNILSSKYEVIPIVDPLEAMEKLVKWEPDAMILAMNMPKLNGLQLVRMLQPNPVLSGIEVIFTHDQVTSGVQRSAQRFSRQPVMAKSDVFRDIEQALNAIFTRPGFRIRPKKTSYNNVAETFARELEEAKKEKQRELQKMYSDQRYQDLRNFIGKHFAQK